MFKRSSSKYNFSYVFTQNIVIVGEVSLLIYALGVFVFSFKLQGTAHPFTYIGLIMAFIFVMLSLFAHFLPPQVQEKLFGGKSMFEDQSYDECSNAGKFHKNYWNQNPATHLNPNPMDYEINADEKPKWLEAPPCRDERCAKCKKQIEYPLYWCRKWDNDEEDSLGLGLDL